MQRVGFLSLIVLTTTLTTAAQQVREQPPLYSGPNVEVPGVFVPPVSGVPFTAAVMIHSSQLLPDGSTETRVSQATIARDSRGRILNERRALMPEGFKGMPPLLSSHIFDPATRISYFMNPMTMIAREMPVSAPRNASNNSGGKSEDLGYSSLNGMQAKGTRISREIPAAFSGTGKDVTVTDEIWYSEELHLNLLEEHTDVRGGKQTVAILSIKRDEPSPALFEVPAGYKIVDLTPRRMLRSHARIALSNSNCPAQRIAVCDAIG